VDLGRWGSPLVSETLIAVEDRAVQSDAVWERRFLQTEHSAKLDLTSGDTLPRRVVHARFGSYCGGASSSLIDMVDVRCFDDPHHTSAAPPLSVSDDLLHRLIVL
jgi:hypothetical protein